MDDFFKHIPKTKKDSPIRKDNIISTHKDTFFNAKLAKHSPANPVDTLSFISKETIIPTKTSPTRTAVTSLTKKPPIITSDTNILTIHNIILEYLTHKYNEIQFHKHKLNRLEWIRDNTDNEIERINAKKEIYRLNRLISSIDNKKEINEYKESVSKLIDKYKRLEHSPSSFINVKRESDKISKITNKFLIAARNYIQIDTRIGSHKLVCSNCHLSDFEVIDDNLYKCNRCNYGMNILDDTCSYKDSDRLNMTSRYTYSKKAHFEEAIQKFQGIQKIEIDDAVYDTISIRMKNSNLTKCTITKDHIYLFLSEGGYSKHYEDIILIYCTITNKKPPNISKYEEELATMFDKQEIVFDSIKHLLDRISSLNVYYKLMKMLQILGYHCNLDDFNFLKTREKILEHDEAWKMICSRLNWQYNPTI